MAEELKEALDTAVPEEGKAVLEQEGAAAEPAAAEKPEQGSAPAEPAAAEKPEQGSAPAEPAAAEKPEQGSATADEKPETMDDFAAEIDKSMRPIKVGDLVDGVVTGVGENGVNVDLGYYVQGFIRPLDYSGKPKFSVANDVHVGDAVKAVVLREEDGNGNILLSRREASERLAWEKFQKMLEEKTDTEMKVVDAVKGGVVGYLDGVRAFVPASQLSLGYVEDLSTFKGQTIPVRVITADPEKKRLVLSSKDILRERREAEKAERISNLKVGLVTEGKVQSLQPYGAFVSLGDGIDGLVHISQIPNNGKRLNHAKDALEVGQTVKVKVTKVENGRISLSMRAALEEEAKPVREEKVTLPKSENIGTSLGSLLKNIKLD